MADPFSIAASALAVAATGGKLAQTLYVLAESVRKSEKQLKHVADHVKLTSAVLDNIGNLLEEDDVRRLCRDSLLLTTSGALDGCRGAFHELRKYVDNLLKPDSSGGKRLGTFDRLTFNSFRSRELDVLQANLEKFKSTLDLVLSVLNLGLSLRRDTNAAEVYRLKSQVDRTMKKNESAEHAVRFAETHFVGDLSVSNRLEDHRHTLPTTTRTSLALRPTRCATLPRSMPAQDSLANASLRPLPSQCLTTVQATDIVKRLDHVQGPAREPSENPARNGPLYSIRQGTELSGISVAQSHGDKNVTKGESNDELSKHLERCAEAVAHLSSTLDQTTRRWRRRNRYKRHGLTPAFHATQKAMKKLWAFEVELDCCDDSDSESLSDHKPQEGGMYAHMGSYLDMSPDRPVLPGEYLRLTPYPEPAQLGDKTHGMHDLKPIACQSVDADMLNTLRHADLIQSTATWLASEPQGQITRPPSSCRHDSIQDSCGKGPVAGSNTEQRPIKSETRICDGHSAPFTLRKISPYSLERSQTPWRMYVKGPTYNSAHFLNPNFQPEQWQIEVMGQHGNSPSNDEPQTGSVQPLSLVDVQPSVSEESTTASNNYNANLEGDVCMSYNDIDAYSVVTDVGRSANLVHQQDAVGFHVQCLTDSAIPIAHNDDFPVTRVAPGSQIAEGLEGTYEEKRNHDDWLQEWSRSLETDFSAVDELLGNWTNVIVLQGLELGGSRPVT